MFVFTASNALFGFIFLQDDLGAFLTEKNPCHQ